MDPMGIKMFISSFWGIYFFFAGYEFLPCTREMMYNMRVHGVHKKKKKPIKTMIVCRRENLLFYNH